MLLTDFFSFSFYFFFTSICRVHTLSRCVVASIHELLFRHLRADLRQLRPPTTPPFNRWHTGASRRISYGLDVAFMVNHTMKQSIKIRWLVAVDGRAWFGRPLFSRTKPATCSILILCEYWTLGQHQLNSSSGGGRRVERAVPLQLLRTVSLRC